MPKTIHSASAACLLLALAPHGADAQVGKPEARPMHYERHALDNDYVRVMRDEARCAPSEPGKCEDRVIVAMADMEIAGGTPYKRKLKRGQIAIYKVGDSYFIQPGAQFYEITIKPGHPPVKSPPESIPPPKNVIMHQNPKFFIYMEVLAVGDTRPRHTHNQRVEIRLSNGPMLHQWVWQGEKIAESEPSRVNWREPIIHEVRNIGDAPLRNFILEFLPQK